MSEQIYEHLPKWRRIIRDLAREAGIKKFAQSSDIEEDKPSQNHDASAPGNERDRAKSGR